MERSYLEQLAGIETPKWRGEMGNDEYWEICHNYCQLRNLAKDLLINPGDREPIVKISELIQKLKLDEVSLSVN